MRLTRVSNLTDFTGGAERLVVDAAVGLRFDETRDGGLCARIDIG